MKSRALNLRVEAATETVTASAGLPFAFVLRKSVETIGLRWEDGGAAQAFIEQTAGGERNVANQFSVETNAVLAPEKFVLRV